MMYKISKYLFLIAFVLIFSGCAKYYYSTILSLNKTDFKEFELYPDYEFFDLRIDIIRQIKSNYYTDNSFSTEYMEYHPIGFNLGNGLFFDLNDNLSISVLELLGIDKNQDFSVFKEDYRTGKILNKYVYKNGEYKIFTNGFLLNFNSGINIFYSDSIIIADLGLLSKYTIYKSTDEFIVNQGIANIKIFKQPKGWYVKNLIGQTDYFQIDNLLTLDNSYTIVNNRNEINVLAGNYSNFKEPIFNIIKNDNELYIYNSNYNGTKIYIENDRIVVEINGKKKYSYYSEY